MQQILHEPSPEVYQLNRHSRGLLQEGFAAWVHYMLVVFEVWRESAL